jgi:hypothetical protein
VIGEEEFSHHGLWDWYECHRVVVTPSAAMMQRRSNMVVAALRLSA